MSLGPPNTYHSWVNISFVLLAHGQLTLHYSFTLTQQMRKTSIMTILPSWIAIQLLPLLHVSITGPIKFTGMGQCDYVRCGKWDEISTPVVSSAGGGTFVRKWKNIADARRNGREARRTYIIRCDWDETSGIPSLILYITHTTSVHLKSLAQPVSFCLAELFFHAHYGLSQISAHISK